MLNQNAKPGILSWMSYDIAFIVLRLLIEFEEEHWPIKNPISAVFRGYLWRTIWGLGCTFLFWTLNRLRPVKSSEQKCTA